MRSVLLTLVTLTALAGPVFGSSPGSETSGERARKTHALSREVMSPYCPGRTLADCPSPDAAVLREEIRDMVDAGVADDQIFGRLQARYGDAVIGVPRTGMQWAVPAIILLLALGAFVVLIRRLVGAGPEAGGPDLESEEELDRKLGL